MPLVTVWRKVWAWSSATSERVWSERVWSERVWSERVWSERVWSERVWSDDAADPRSHPGRRIRRRHRQPRDPRVLPGRLRSPRGRSRCSRGWRPRTRIPAQSLHVDEVATPELAPDEVYVAVMASAINFNTVWTSIFEPLPTFGFLDRLGREGVWGARHALTSTSSAPTPPAWCSGSAPRSATGSRAIGSPSTATTSTTRTPPPTTTRCWRPTSASGASRPTSAGLADLAVVKANQLMPKPAHLTWEEAACNALCNSTSYRMIVSPSRGRPPAG